MSREEAELVRETLRGRRAAFSELYRRRCRLVTALCYDACGDAEAAADLTQEVFLRAYQKLGRLEDPTRFGPWLIGIARRVCGESRRHGDRYRRRLVRVAERQGAPEASEMTDEHAALRSAIAALPERERLALHAFYLEEQRIESVTELLGVSRASAYRLLARARNQLREVLSSKETLS